jgi:hypothetical protein
VADFTFYYGAPDLATAAAAYAAWSLYLASSATWKGQFSSTTNFDTGTVSQVDEATGVVVATTTAGTGYNGSAVGGVLPPQVAVVVTLRTDLAGKSTTGRFYLPGTADITQSSVGRLLATPQNDLVTEMAAALLALKAVSADEVLVYSRTHRSSRAVVTIDIGDVFDTQRRRRDKLMESRISVTI